MEYTIIPFEIKECKEDDNYFYVDGKAAAYGNIDLGRDLIESNCFYEDLRQKGGKRPILWSHKADMPIGVGEFSEISNALQAKIKMPKADTFVSGRMIPQFKIGSITGLSIGYKVDEFSYREIDGKMIRILSKCQLKETSPVVFPMNEEARVEMIKSFKHEDEDSTKEVPSFRDYPIADDVQWDKAKAVKQIRQHTNSKEKPSSAYKNCFMFYDSEKEEDFTAYKMPYVYWVDGEFKAIPKALSAIVGALSGARGGVNIPAGDKAKIKTQINKYYKKMNREEPFKKKGITFIDLKTLECLEKRDFEKLFDDNIILSTSAKKKIVDSIVFSKEDDTQEKHSFLDELKALSSEIEK